MTIFYSARFSPNNVRLPYKSDTQLVLYQIHQLYYKLLLWFSDDKIFYRIALAAYSIPSSSNDDRIRHSTLFEKELRIQTHLLVKFHWHLQIPLKFCLLSMMTFYPSFLIPEYAFYYLKIFVNNIDNVHGIMYFYVCFVFLS